MFKWTYKSYLFWGGGWAGGGNGGRHIHSFIHSFNIFRYGWNHERGSKRDRGWWKHGCSRRWENTTDSYANTICGIPGKNTQLIGLPDRLLI